MISLTSMTLLASGTALLLSIGALFVACLSWLRYRSTSAAKLSARLTVTESMCEELSAELKAIRQARNMAASRARKQQEADDPEAKRAAALRALTPRIGGFPHA